MQVHSDLIPPTQLANVVLLTSLLVWCSVIANSCQHFCGKFQGGELQPTHQERWLPPLAFCFRPEARLGPPPLIPPNSTTALGRMGGAVREEGREVGLELQLFTSIGKSKRGHGKFEK